MSIGRLIRISTKAGVGGGVVYYAYELGLWKNSDQTIKNYAIFKQDVNGFLESSPALVEYVKTAGDSVQTSVKPITEPVSNFRKEWLDFDLCEKTKDGVIKSTWNKGVEVVIDGIAATPATLKGWTVTGWEKLSELASNAGSTSSPTNSS
ncbi:unnamed protein product [Allacma fusca]|uniref:MICOS complex subunit MIC13 n=1 Tax=Allacma fusca TaxID=39272 RepID=A0A8J2NVB5_9HEXA|nr:unnamed protein product [Allacma fusca]